MPEFHRRDRRRGLVLYLPVFDADTGDELGRLVDLTREGMRLVGNREIPIGDRRRLRIVLPEEAASPELCVTTVCRWSGHDVNPDLAAAGLLFEDPDPEARSALECLLQNGVLAGC